MKVNFLAVARVKSVLTVHSISPRCERTLSSQISVFVFGELLQESRPYSQIREEIGRKM